MMRSFVLSLVAAVAAVRVVAGPLAQFTVTPSGAAIFVNGENKGVATPTLQVPDLKPDSNYVVKYVLPGYVPLYQSVRMEKNGVSRNVRLEPQKGLLLITSEPVGAAVYDERDIRIGQTPCLVTSLTVLDPHELTLCLNGYQDTKVRVSFDGRRPQTVKVPLTSSSGSFEVTSEPAGATVQVNGKDAGLTPTKVQDVAKGRAKVRLTLDGYEPAEREINVAPGENASVSFALQAYPSSLTLESNPSGARFYLEAEPFGEESAEPLGNDSIVVRDGLKPGRYRVRAELKGYATKTATYDIGPGQKKADVFVLDSVMGALQIVTQPGVTVCVDGRKKGVTSAASPDAKKCDPFRVRDLVEGEHELRLEMSGHGKVTESVMIEARQTKDVVIRLKEVFTPDTRVIFIDGEPPLEGVKVSDSSRMGGVLTLRQKDGMLRNIPAHRIDRQEAIFER